ncbi:MAG: glycosyltransferase family 4 protein [Kiritimatiellia bacterium]
MEPKTYHILQVVPELNEGGVERGVVELNRLFHAAGWRNSVLTRGGKLCQQIKHDGGKVFLADVASKNILTVPWRILHLRHLLKQIKPDLIHIRSRVPGWLIRLSGTQIPIVTTVHGINHIGKYSSIMLRGEKHICPSHFVADFVCDAYDIPPKKVRVIPRGIDPITFTPDHLDRQFIADWKAKWSLSGAFVILAVGRITPLKGLDILIQAVAKLKGTQCPNAKLLIVGGVDTKHADYLARLKRLAAELGVANSVHFAGSQRQLAEIYSCAQVTVSATTAKPETFGRSMAESLALNVPVVATRHGGALDIVREGLDGFLVTPGSVDEMAECLWKVSQSTFGDLRSSALARFSLQHMADETLAVYREVLEQ